MSLIATIEEAKLRISFPGAKNESVGNCTQGDTVRIQATFQNFDSALVDPPGVAFYVFRDADENFTFQMYGGGQVLKSETGVYYLDVSTAAESGTYEWRVTGIGYGAKQGSFYVEPADPA
jgi:hypothetical protein